MASAIGSQRAETEEKRAATEHKVGTERHRSSDIETRAHPAVEQHRHLAPDALDDRRQRIDGCNRAVELTAAVI